MNKLKKFLLFLLIFPIIMILVFPIVVIDLFEDFVEFLKTIRFLLESTIKDIFIWWRNK